MDLTDKEAALDAHCTIVCGHKHDAICLMECPDYEVFNHLPSVQPAAKDTNVLNNDCISRQAAIDAVENAFDRETILNRFVRKIAISAIRLLPSAQPEVIRCKDCTYQVESWSGIKYCEAHGDHIGARREENG